MAASTAILRMFRAVIVAKPAPDGFLMDVVPTQSARIAFA